MISLCTVSYTHLDVYKRQPVFSTALYHQSTFNDLFVKGLSVTAGLRLEYEKTSMNYFSDSNIAVSYTHLSSVLAAS